MTKRRPMGSRIVVGPGAGAGAGAGAGSGVGSGLEPLEKRQFFDADMGINVNNFSADTYKPIVAMLRASGTKDVRLWYGFDSYGIRSQANVTKYVQKFHNDGFDVTISVVPEKGRHGSADDTRGLFEYLVSDDAGLTPYVDHWEIGNEVDSEKYWRGTLGEYVSDFLTPAARVLHNVGESVISGSVSWNPADIKTMVDAGMLKLVDYVGYHPYRNSVTVLKSAIKELRGYVGDKPLAATEWNIRGYEDDSRKDWANAVKDYWPVIQQNFAIAHYFASVVQDSKAGPAGVLTGSGKPNAPFYAMYMGLAQQGNDDDNDSDNGGTDTGDNDGGSKSSDGDDDDSDGGNTGGSKGSSSDGDADGSSGGKTGGSKSGGSTSGGTKTGSGGKTSSGTKTSTGGKASTGTGSGGTSTPVVTPPPAPVIPPSISSVGLLNADRDRSVKAYSNLSGAMTLDLATIGTTFLSMAAATNKKTGSVQFVLNGNTYTDSSGDFTLFGEKGKNLLGQTFDVNHTYVLTATPYSGPDATGRAGTMVSMAFAIVDSSATTPEAVAAALDAKRRAVAAARRAARLTPVRLPGL